MAKSHLRQIYQLCMQIWLNVWNCEFHFLEYSCSIEINKLISLNIIPNQIVIKIYYSIMYFQISFYLFVYCIFDAAFFMNVKTKFWVWVRKNLMAFCFIIFLSMELGFYHFCMGRFTFSIVLKAALLIIWYTTLCKKY